MTTSISLPESSTDPTQEPNKVELYAKDAAGISQLYARSDDGTVHQLTPPSGSSGSPADIYGDGSDGSLVFDGALTVLGLVPVANVYTMTRDIFPANCTINVGVTLKTNGFRIFGNGTLTLHGTISDAGQSGSNGGLGLSGTGGWAAGLGRGAAYYPATASGGRGGDSVNGNGPAQAANPTWCGGSDAGGANGIGAVGVPGTNGTAGAGRYKAGGGGGGGGNSTFGGGGNSGSAGGTVTASAESTGRRPNTYVTVAGTSTAVAGSGGGGGGSAWAIALAEVCGGGGGGAGGGHVFLAYRYIAGSGVVTAAGGNGGNGRSFATIRAGGGGGGAGGAGGNVCVYTQTLQAGLAGITFTAAGGAGGAAGIGDAANGGKNGGTGGNGSNGVTSINAGD